MIDASKLMLEGHQGKIVGDMYGNISLVCECSRSIHFEGLPTVQEIVNAYHDHAYPPPPREKISLINIDTDWKPRERSTDY